MTPKRTAEVTKARYFADEDEAQAKTATNELDITVEDGAKVPAENNKQHKSDIPAVIPILPLRGLVVYPQTAIPLTVGQPRSIKLVDDVISGDRLIGLVAAKDPDMETPGPDDVYQIGTLASIHRLFRAPDGTIRLLVQGLARIRIDEYTEHEPYLRAHVTAIPETLEDTVEVEALVRNVADQFTRLADLVPNIPSELITNAVNVEELDPLQLAYRSEERRVGKE